MEHLSPSISHETEQKKLSALDRWIVRHATIIRRLIHTPHGNVLRITQAAKEETGNQSHVRISESGITHQLTGLSFRTLSQLEELLHINVTTPDA